MGELTKLSAEQLATKIRNKELTATEVVSTYLGRIKNVDGKINAFLELFEEKAVLQAKEVDSKIQAGKPVGKLAGVPIAIKDNICIKNQKATCASKILENYVAPYDAKIIQKLREADAIFIGRTNMDEFAMGSSTETSHYQITRNPWNTDYIPGGSSGGSAAAVSANMVPLAIGSDTGGSIRQPASCCGIVGLKPTYGRVSRYGLVAFASSLDQIGPFTNNVRDCALLLEVIGGYDDGDTTSVNLPIPNYLKEIENAKNLTGLKIGLPKEYFIEGIDKEVEKSVRDAVKVLEGLGAKVVEVSLPHTEYALAVYYVIAPSEASANLARYDSVKYGFRSKDTSDLIDTYETSRGEGFGAEVKRRIVIGTYALSAGYYEAYYGKAQKVRTLIKRDFEQAFEKVDVIITPTAPTPAFKIGEKTDDPLQMYLSDIFTISCNLAGIPGLNIPCGLSSKGLPIGMQIFAKHFAEENIFRTAYAYESNIDWKNKIK